MKIIQANNQALLASALSAAWAREETFACLPAKAVLSRDQIEKALAALPAALGANHFVMLTSGSTGEPKFIVASKARALRLAATLHAAQRSESVAETVSALPLSYTYAFVNQFVWSQHFGRRLVVSEGLSAPDSLHSSLLLARDAMLCLVGAQVPLLLRYWGSEQFTGITRLHFAGGRFPQESLPALAQLFPSAAVFNNYGCAEAMPRLTVREASSDLDAQSIGKPIAGVELRARDDESLEFRSAYQAVGLVQGGVYQAIDDSAWTPTGDLGHATPDGGWQLIGRCGEVFKRFGEKVSLPAILGSVRSVWSGESALFVDHDASGELAHVLALAPPPDKVALNEILKGFRTHFSRAQWPVRVVALDAIPMLPNGKPDLKQLAAMPDLPILWKQRI